ncbi:MAG: hypothetical protein ACKOOG_06730 [Actinomycetota bacterium]
MILLVVVAVVLTALMAFSWVAVAREPGPGPADVAIAYERAWDNLDFELLYHLSGEELRDGMRRERFVRVKRAAHDRAGTPVRLGTPIDVESSIAGNVAALVVTRIGSADEAIRNNVTLERRANGWVVVGYGLRVEPGPPAR